MALEALGDDFRRMLVWREILDRLETAIGGGGEPVEKLDFLEDEAEISGEFRHGTVLVCGRHDGRLL
jgi:hypothetical protein